MSTKYTASQIADATIAFCNDHGDLITNLKLQKLLYYVQAWHLALHSKPLFSDKFEAWVHGPAIPSIYGKFKKFGFQPVQCDGAKTLDTHTQNHLAEVIKVYGGMTAYELERLTHSKDPWIKARKGLPADASSHNKISEVDMQHFYASKMK